MRDLMKTKNSRRGLCAVGLIMIPLLLPGRAARAQDVPSFTNITDRGIAAGVGWTNGTARFLLQKKFNFSDSNWVNLLTTSNRSVLLAKDSPSCFLLLLDQTTNTVLPFTF